MSTHALVEADGVVKNFDSCVRPKIHKTITDTDVLTEKLDALNKLSTTVKKTQAVLHPYSILPPYLAIPLLKCESADPLTLLMKAIEVIQKYDTDNNMAEAASLAKTVCFPAILLLFWAHQKEKATEPVVPLPVSLVRHASVLAWADTVHNEKPQPQHQHQLHPQLQPQHRHHDIC